MGAVTDPLLRPVCGRCRSPQAGAAAENMIAQLDDAIESTRKALSLQEHLLGSLESARSGLARGGAPKTRTEQSSAPADGGHSAGALTRQERRVLDLLSRGSSNREISRALDIAEKTAKNHVYSIFRKLGVRSRTEAALAWTNDEASTRRRNQIDHG
ncbi:hypothetical protein ACRB68_57520 [Actinomadura sp. RB68]|uniref:HTH luxR-type domain-containing protein n=2 Tax=Actinomadura macrotermitis TaxID=2585200 RepID=A0A7K0C2K2_9ACTN|nr:hypothetical protein [Actinomadura macrotermitis]